MNLATVQPLAAATVMARRAVAPHQALGLRFLCYHSVTDESSAHAQDDAMTITANTLRDHTQIVRHRGLRLVSMHEALDILHSGDGGYDSRAVCMTFDDGYADNCEIAWPVLREQNCPAHFFVSAEFALGSRPCDAHGKRYATLEQLERIVQEGATVGCHGATHIDLRGVAPAALEAETIGAKRVLEDALQASISTFAYPFGAHDPRTLAAVERAGYSAAFIVRLGALRGATYPRWTVPRTIVDSRDTLAVFDLKISGGYDWLATYSATKQWWHSRASRAAAESHA
jgi:peptidoglycan/xylan/chitin deacetylase (PgdA/CDA1 family)